MESIKLFRTKCKTLFLSVICLIVILMSFTNSEAMPINYIAPGDVWDYTFADPGTGWQNVGFDDSSWLSGNAPFGNYNSCYGSECDFIPNTYWPANTDPWLRFEFDLTNAVEMHYYIGADNGFDLWINGSHIANGNAGGFTWNWEYDGLISSSAFSIGENVVAIKLEDHGGLTAFDMMLVGDDSGMAPVPEPSTMILLAGGLAGLFFSRKKIKT